MLLCATCSSTTHSVPPTAPQASTGSVAQAPPVACAGVLMAGGIRRFGQALKQPAHPMVAIVAGSKVSTKLTILNLWPDKVDQSSSAAAWAQPFLLAEGKSPSALFGRTRFGGRIQKSWRKWRPLRQALYRCRPACCREAFAADGSCGERHCRRCRRRHGDFGHRPKSAAALADLLKAAGHGRMDMALAF